MKANQRTWILLLLLLVATAFQLPAQQSEADRKLLAEIRAKTENKIIEPADSIISDARKLYADINQFVEQLIAKIDLVDKTYPQKEGEGFLHGFKELSVDGGKSYVLINEHVLKVSSSRNGVRMALDAFDALTHKPTAHDRAKLATEFMFNTDMCFLTSERPTSVMIQGLRVAKQDEMADDMEKKYDNLKIRSLSMRLKMYSLVRDYLEKNK